MMSGGPIAKFTHGWAVKIFGFGKAHYWRRDGAADARPLCKNHRAIPVAFLRGAGTFTKCKRCLEIAPQQDEDAA